MAITVETALDRRMITAIIASSLGFSLDLFDLFILLYVAEHILQQAALGVRDLNRLKSYAFEKLGVAA